MALLGFIGDQFFTLYNYYQSLIGQEFTRKLLFSVAITTKTTVATRRHDVRERSRRIFPPGCSNAGESTKVPGDDEHRMADDNS